MKAYLNILVIMAAVCFSVSMMTGGWKEVTDLDAEHIQKYAKFAVAKISTSMNSKYQMKLDEVIRAKQQVVSGMKYNMTVVMAPTECKTRHNMTEEELDNCPFLACGSPFSCNVTIWVQAWLENGTRIISSRCSEVNNNC